MSFSRRKKFDHRRFIDRDFEQELFEELLTLSDAARILAIKDGGGMGKSHLLNLFRYRCMTVARTPVSYVSLDQLDDPSPLGLVQKLARDLSRRSGLPLPQYEAWQAWRNQQDFASMPGEARGHVQAQGASFRQTQDTQVAGTIINKMEVQGDLHLSQGAATAEQLAKAAENTVQAFMDDLHAYCHTKPVVWLLDAYEKCDPSVQEWLEEELLEPHCFAGLSGGPDKLLLVVAGRELPPLLTEESPVVKSVHQLSRWDKPHIAECLRLYDYPYSEQELETFHLWAQGGLALSEIIKMIETLLVAKRRG